MRRRQKDDDNDEIDLGALAIILWAGKWRIALTCVAALGLGGAWLLNTAPTYQANALIQIEDKAPSLALPDGLAALMNGGGGGASNAELELLHSRLTLGTAVAKAHLDWVANPLQAPLIGYAVAGQGLPLPEIGEGFALDSWVGFGGALDTSVDGDGHVALVSASHCAQSGW